MTALEEWAKQHPPRQSATAWLMSIPEWDEIKSAVEKGTPPTLIRRWLIEDRGYSPTEATEGRTVDFLRKRAR